ncbi:MAG: AMIN domain-containing protein [Desulfobulbus sp.]|jgi:type IV pilus assembly protein PilQ|uniref:AMIN domain-containing protein n=1 Tax=Desulfobulbus sp. TaxID=895 RepID=UPI00284DF61C|nr:AMIN domain-containing protein [Desulfobulbus sp.]MDR2549669.1 AMIN domain-containing protein [Desulfobulbus sp.]
MMMLQVISNAKKYIISFLSIFIGYSLIISANYLLADDAVQVKTVDVVRIGESVEIKISGANAAASTVYELPNPDRIVVDLADAVLANNFISKIDVTGISLQTKLLAESKPAILRLEFALPGKADFQTQKNDNELKLVLKLAGAAANDTSAAQQNNATNPAAEGPKEGKEASVSKNQRSGDKIGSMIGASKSIDSQLPDINPLEAKHPSKGKAQQMEDSFNFSGYNKERITVEFQKMDLHNVFNFLRQVSGVNIVVDESVQGALTLVLDDVPWDFALDIILNLKDLEKEERYNTLVIYPKKKEFKWPDKSQNNLSFQADSKVVARESLTIRQQGRQTVENPEARKQISLGSEAEKNENYDLAVTHYERAYEKWSSNTQLTNKIASIYLVHLRQYAKSLYYSSMTLKNDKDNNEAMLLAAISAANMQDKDKAAHYFSKCTSVKKPIKEALMSYSSFCEGSQDYQCALDNLTRYNSLYGEDLDSMISAARIYDKMGQGQKAIEKYNQLLSSGFQVPPDLERYIKGRVAIN